jgi:starch synthase
MNKHIIMIASENDALVGGKVGGVGDVVRNLPRALASLGWQCTVIIPSYGFIHQRNPSELFARVAFPFRGQELTAEVWRVTAKEPCEGVMNYVVDHDDIRGNPIYYDDPPETPFMRDATKYAAFCSAVGSLLNSMERPAVLHLHDWHAATLFLLRDLHPSFSHLKGIRTAFTIHNLAIQGTRPMRRHESSVESWFPELFINTEWVHQWKDERYKDPCYTPMMIGIKNADTVNTVSPTYAEEILLPSNHLRGYYGGEGLEKVLRRAKQEGHLFGILNGCDYPEHRPAQRMSFPELQNVLYSEVQSLKLKNTDQYYDTLLEKIRQMENFDSTLLLTTVTRIVDQKIRLLFERTGDGTLVLDNIMKIVAQRNGVFIVLGSGSVEYERRLIESSQQHERLLFIRGYSERIANALYVNGTLFVMPSSFEPCGISQMIAMREGQPCIVHAVGGLKDTVQHGKTGFTFSGETPGEQADEFVQTVEEAVKMFTQEPEEWKRVASAARIARFTWEQSARQYDRLMYGG